MKQKLSSNLNQGEEPLSTFKSIFCIFIMLLIVVTTIYGQTEKQLYEQKCGRCHVAFSPSDYSSEEWPGIVKSMKAQASLTSQEITELTSYLVEKSQKNNDKTNLNRPNIGGYLYTEYFQTPEKVKNYDIHYLAMYISGWANEKINYFAEFELEHGGTGGSNTFVEQAYIDYWFTPTIAIKIGAMLTPFNRFDEFHDPITNYIITRPQMSREIGVSAWKDVGVNFHGYFNITSKSSLGFDLYSINGLGSGTDLRHSRQYRDNNENKALGGRLNFIFNDFFEVGGSAYQGAWDDEGKYNLVMFGAHALLNTPIADFYGEFVQATSENPEGTEEGDLSGYFIQASRLIKDRFRPTIRFGSLDYLDKADVLGRSASKGNKEVNELAFGLTYYPTSKVAFKVEYTLFAEGDRVQEKDNDQFGLQAAIKF
jgi:hypothetical protein